MKQKDIHASKNASRSASTQPRILVLTVSHLCRNPRAAKEASALAAAGFDVTVLNALQFKGLDKEDDVIAAGQSYKRVHLDLLSPRFAVQVRRFLARAVTRIARDANMYLRLETGAALGPVGPLLSMARSHPADLTILHNEVALWAGSRLARSGCRIAVDMEDWYSEDLLPEDRRNRPLRLLRTLERDLLRSAAYSSCTSDSMSRALASAYGCPAPVPIRNTFPLLRGSRLDRPFGSEVSFVWFSQTVGPGRGLEEFVSAWSRMAVPTTLSLRGELRSGFNDVILGGLTAQQRDRVRFLPLLPPHELAHDLTQFDIGLALEHSSPPNKDVTISNKIFQYMNAGLAVIATSTAGQREVHACAPDAVRLIDLRDPMLPVKLDSLVSHKAAVLQMCAAARAAAEQQFCWEVESRKLVAAVAGVVGTPAHVSR